MTFVYAKYYSAIKFKIRMINKHSMFCKMFVIFTKIAKHFENFLPHK